MGKDIHPWNGRQGYGKRLLCMANEQSDWQLKFDPKVFSFWRFEGGKMSDHGKGGKGLRKDYFMWLTR